MKSRLRYVALMICVFSLMWIGWQSTPHILFSHHGTEYRTQDEIYATFRSLGWTVVQQPNDGRRYRVLGAIHDNDPNSTRTVIAGGFSTADGRSTRFEVPKEYGVEVNVEGLDPEGGRELQFAVLTRPFDSLP